MLVFVVPVSAESWVKFVEGKKIIKFDSTDPTSGIKLQAFLREGHYSKNVILLVHGVEIIPTKTDDYFNENFCVKLAQNTEDDTIILVEWVPEGKSYFGTPEGSLKAAFALESANRIVKTETGYDPSLYCHSNGCVGYNKHEDLGIANNWDTRWSKVFLTGSAAPLTQENRLKWESRAGTYRDEKNNEVPAVFWSMFGEDIARFLQKDYGLQSFTQYDSVCKEMGSRCKEPDIGISKDLIPRELISRSIIHLKYTSDEGIEKTIKNSPKVVLPNSHDKEKKAETPVELNQDDDKKFVKTRPSPQFSPPCPPYCICGPFCDDDGGDLGGVNFSHVELTAISTNLTVTPSGQYGFFNYVLRGEKEKSGTATIDVRNSSELAYNTFFVGLFMPNNLFWVNLNPWEPNRLLGDGLEKTDAGRVMLEADLQMKKDFANYKNPCESDVGAQYWKKLDEKSDQLVQNLKKKYPNDFNEKDIITFSTVSRNWIVPDKINAQGTGDTIYLESATLKIESEPVYEHSQYDVKDRLTFLFSQSVKDDLAAAAKEYGKYSMELQDEMIRPLVIRDINTQKEYADLRTVYHSLILAQWYKNKFQSSPALFSDEFNSGKIVSYESDTPWKPESTWQAYRTSFEEHEYECIKTQEFTQGTTKITSTKTYEGGGVKFDNIPLSITEPPSQKIQTILTEATVNYYASDEDNYYIGEPVFVYGTTNTEIIPGGDGKNSASESGFIDSIIQSLLGNLLEHRIYPGQYGSS
jgi:hypothetical protein